MTSFETFTTRKRLLEIEINRKIFSLLNSTNKKEITIPKGSSVSTEFNTIELLTRDSLRVTNKFGQVRIETLSTASLDTLLTLLKFIELAIINQN